MTRNLAELKKCLLAQDEEGFNKALTQTVFLYQVPLKDRRFNVGKAMYGNLIV